MANHWRLAHVAALDAVWQLTHAPIYSETEKRNQIAIRQLELIAAELGELADIADSFRSKAS